MKILVCPFCKYVFQDEPVGGSAHCPKCENFFNVEEVEQKLLELNHQTVKLTITGKLSFSLSGSIDTRRIESGVIDFVSLGHELSIGINIDCIQFDKNRPDWLVVNV